MWASRGRGTSTHKNRRGRGDHATRPCPLRRSPRTQARSTPPQRLSRCRLPAAAGRELQQPRQRHQQQRERHRRLQVLTPPPAPAAQTPQPPPLTPLAPPGRPHHYSSGVGGRGRGLGRRPCCCVVTGPAARRLVSRRCTARGIYEGSMHGLSRGLTGGKDRSHDVTRLGDGGTPQQPLAQVQRNRAHGPRVRLRLRPGRCCGRCAPGPAAPGHWPVVRLGQHLADTTTAVELGQL